MNQRTRLILTEGLAQVHAVLTSQSIQTRGASDRVSAMVDEAETLFNLGVSNS